MFFFVVDPVNECSECLLSKNYSGRGSMAVRLTHEKKNYGFMVLSIPRELAVDKTEKSIVKEISNDIAFGLYKIDLEEKRKSAKKAQQESKIRFKTLIENSLNCISIIQDNKKVYRNPGLRKVHRLITKAFEPPGFENIYTEDQNRIKKAYNDLITNKIRQIETDFRYYPEGVEKEESQVRWALISARKIDYMGIESVLTNVMDITDSKKIENFLRIQDKMTSLGRVTAGIAHEIRNPLSGIYIYLKALKKYIKTWGILTGSCL
jgi:PAS domain-containing protein